MVEEFDPLEEESGAPGGAAGRGELLDLPLGGDEAASAAADERPPLVTWEPRHRRRPPRRIGPWLLVLLLAAAAAAGWWLWPRGAPARIEPSAGELDFGPRRIAAPGEPLAMVLTNGGERPLRVRRLELTGAAELFEIAAETCVGRRIAPAEQCRLAIDYRPVESGTHEAVLRIVARAANSPLELPLRGAGVAPRLAAAPERLVFDALPVGGRSAGRGVTLESVGDAPVKVEEARLGGPAGSEFRLERDRCGGREVAPGADCGLRVAFAPSAEGERRAELRVTSDAIDGLLAIALSGTGLPAPRVALEPSRLEFGEQRVGERSAPRTLTLRNRGGDSLRLGRARLPADAGGFTVARDGCSSRTLAAGAECALELVFAPGREGAISRQLELPQAGGTGLSWAAELEGTAVAPRAVWSARVLDWGESRVGVGQEPRGLRLRNGGSGTLAVSAVRLGGRDAEAFAIAADGCAGASLEPGEECELALGFRATRLGGHRASLTAAGRGVPGDRGVELAGSGVAGRIATSVSRLEFGSVRVSEAGSRELELSNTGNAELTLEGFSAAGSASRDFRVSGDCRVGAVLPPEDGCRLVVRFAPQQEGGRLATLEISHDGVDSPARVGLSGAALPPPPGRLEVEPARLDFGEVAVGERSAILPLTLRNSGRGRVRLGEIAVAGAQAGEFRIVPGTCEGIPYLAPGGRCGIGLRFLPAAGGERRATLRVRHDAPGGARTVPLSGLGLGGSGP